MISKSKSRSIKVGDVSFRYKVSSKPRSKGVYELNITIISEESNASRLLVTGVLQHDLSIEPPQCPDDYSDHQYQPTITRDDIEGFIKEAIERGWDYKTRGRDFELPSSNEPFRLIAYWEDRPKEWFQGRNFHRKQQTE